MPPPRASCASRRSRRAASRTSGRTSRSPLFRARGRRLRSRSRPPGGHPSRAARPRRRREGLLARCRGLRTTGASGAVTCLSCPRRSANPRRGHPNRLGPWCRCWPTASAGASPPPPRATATAALAATRGTRRRQAARSRSQSCRAGQRVRRPSRRDDGLLPYRRDSRRTTRPMRPGRSPARLCAALRGPAHTPRRPAGSARARTRV